MADPLDGQAVLPEYEAVLGFSVYKHVPTILAFADVHLGNYRYPIRDRILGTMAEIVSMVKNYAPDVVIFAGDAFRTKVPSAQDVAAFGDFLARLARYSRVLMIPGNHDITGNSTTLDVYANYDHVWLYKEPEVVNMGSYEIVMVPWLPQRALSSFGLEAESTAGITELLIQLLKNKLTPGKLHLLVAHATAFGCSYGDTNVVIGHDVLWMPDWFDGFDLSILGHLHKPQAVPNVDNVRYTGSICPTSFNETGQVKSVLLYKDGNVTLPILGSPMFLQATPENLEGASDEDFVNCFLQVKRPYDDPDPEVPPCLWYEIVPEKPPRDIRQRLDAGEAASMTAMEAIEAYLQQEDIEPEPVLKLAAELMEGDDEAGGN